jgi:hypothetical protein
MANDQRGQVVHGVVHFAAHVESPTACGKIGPASRDWKFVDCFICLAKKHEPAPDHPWPPSTAPITVRFVRSR